MLIPPPIAEQLRIGAKVEVHMASCIRRYVTQKRSNRGVLGLPNEAEMGFFDMKF